MDGLEQTRTFKESSTTGTEQQRGGRSESDLAISELRTNLTNAYSEPFALII